MLISAGETLKQSLGSFSGCFGVCFEDSGEECEPFDHLPQDEE